MPRGPRINAANIFYHILSRGNRSQVIFADDKDRIKLLDYLGKYSLLLQFRIHCYCLMDNHFHLLLESSKPNLSQLMQRLLCSYTLYFNQKNRQRGHLFQGRFKSVIVEKESYLLELSRYIHLNAVRAKVIERPEEYHWSSLRRYVGLSSKPDFVYTKDILAYFNYEGSKYLQFVYEGIEKEINLQPIDGMFLGSRKFVEKIKGHLYQRNDLSNLKQIQQPLSMEQIISKISQHYKILPNELNNRNRRPNFSECRKMIIYVVRAKTSLSLKEIGQRMGSIGPQAVNNIIKKIELSPDLKKKANEFLGKV